MEILNYNPDGLIPAIVQDSRTGEVLTLAWMNEESLGITLKEGRVCFYSRSRKALWRKGETSGNFLNVVSIKADCDRDALLIKAAPDGPACHTGAKSCFFNSIKDGGADFANGADFASGTDFSIGELHKFIKNRKENPVKDSYTNYLFLKGDDKILKKIGEETAEVIIAAKNKNNAETIYEISDLVYHVLVLMANCGIEVEDIIEELAKRHK
jgi:phosphoribosyl-ATP pyrophosphohydrolase/phosphoribosyl-AMP cyclohydrolase